MGSVHRFNGDHDITMSDALHSNLTPVTLKAMRALVCAMVMITLILSHLLYYDLPSYPIFVNFAGASITDLSLGMFVIVSYSALVRDEAGWAVYWKSIR